MIPSQHMQLSEILGSLSCALDMTEGHLQGHALRTCWIGVHIGRQMGLTDAAIGELYYTLLLKDVGCSSTASRVCELYLADDIALKAKSRLLADGIGPALAFVLKHTGRNAGLRARIRAVFNIARNGPAIVDELFQTRCERGAGIARLLRFPDQVAAGIHALDEHWDGSGRPQHLRGTEIPIYARIALVAQVADVFHATNKRAGAAAEVRSRTGVWFDPDVAAAFQSVADDPDFWDVLEGPDLARAVAALEPHQQAMRPDDRYLDDIAAAFAKVIDAKSPFTSGHSDRVADLTEALAGELGYSKPRQRSLRRAALLHDIGKLGVSNAILDKPGKLDDGEWQAMRSHAAMSEQILAPVRVFQDAARIGGGHHERLDGGGYPRKLVGDRIPLHIRIVSTADVFDALTADRPYRPAMPVERALSIMQADVGKAFDPDCFAALTRIAERRGALVAA